MTNPTSNDTAPTLPIESLRRALLHLHELLIAYERVRYERVHGRVESPNEMLQLVTGHEAFAWLRPLSMVIVAIDELEEPFDPAAAADQMTADQPTAAQVARALTEPLLTAGSDFYAHYIEVMQQAPEIIVARADVSRALRAIPEHDVPC